MSNSLQAVNYAAAKVMEGLQLNATNTQLNALLQQYTSTATSAGTTTLTNSTTLQQWFTGSTTHNIILPDATTLYVGYSVIIVNNSTGTLTVKLNDTSTTQATLVAGDVIMITAASIGTSNGTWANATLNQGSITVIVKSSWTPADGSGAALSFTSVNGKYSQLSNIVRFYETLTYPSTADTSSAIISGLPASAAYGETCTGYTSNGILVQGTFSGTTILLKDAQGNALTNVNLSGATLVLSGSYQV